MNFEKSSKYKVYHLTVAQAIESFKRGIARDPRTANRPISFYFPDQFTYPLACPPSSDAREGAPASTARSGESSSDAREGAPASTARRGESSSDAREGAPASTARSGESSSDAREGVLASTVRSGESSSDARDGDERPTKEAERGFVPLGVVLKIADPKVRQTVLRRRALEIGNGVCSTWTDLMTLIHSEFPEVRRLAASAIKKRLECDSSVGRLLFRPLVEALVQETYPQTQQYMLSALKRCATDLDDGSVDYLKDVARDPTLSRAFRETANQIVHDFETHKKLKESVYRHWCHRCKKPITKEESAAGIAKYGKPYCKRCLDERLLGDVNFENQIEVAKTRRTLDGVAVQSRGEKRIADWLASHHIPYEYDERYRIVEDTTIRPDFYLREFDLYIECWGMNTPQYLANRRKKMELYQREGRKLISLDYTDDSRLEEKLFERLSLQIPALTLAGAPFTVTRPASSGMKSQSADKEK